MTTAALVLETSTVKRKAKRPEKSTGYNEPSFFIPESLNDKHLQGPWSRRARRRPMSSWNDTYNELRALMRKQTESSGDPSTSALSNHESALTGFLRERCIDPAETIGATLRTMSYRHVSSHLATLVANGASGAYIRNRKSSLVRWRRLLSERDAQDAKANGDYTPFEVELRRLFEAGATIKGTARAIGMPLATLKRWLAGAAPTCRSIHYIERIERVFGMAPSHLRGLLPRMKPEPQPAVHGAGSSHNGDEGEAELKLLMAPEDATDECIREWIALKEYKTQSFLWEEEAAIPEDIEDAGRPWRLKVMPPGKKKRCAWIDVVGNQHSGSARHAFGLACAYYGWMQLGHAGGGLGMAPVEAQHLCHLADAEKIRAYVRWRKKKTGSYTRTTINFLSFASMLCRPSTGFLAVHPEWGRAVGLNNAEQWTKRCARTRSLIALMRRDIRSKLVVTHDRESQLKGALGCKNPLQALAEAIKRHLAAKPLTGGMLEAIWARDHALLYVSASCAVRACNLRELTHTRDNAGHLRRTAAGEWLVVIPRAQLKNGEYRGDLCAYVVPSAWRFLDRYFRDYRPKFGSSSYVFASRDGDQGPWESLSARFRTVTGRTLEGCKGIGPQVMRHLVASGLARLSGSTALSARALHDSERTVDDYYVLDEPQRVAQMLDELLK
jgi:hypothetical protein